MNRTQLHSLRRARQILTDFRAAVSLHGHTMHSEEALSSVLRYVPRVPIAGRVFRLLEERYRSITGRTFDYQRAYWTPPLPPQSALDLERCQIEDKLALAPLVSLTDHDNIHASSRLRVLESSREMPGSLEWTVPLGPSFLHIGVHNLPPHRAEDWVRELNAYTRCPMPALLADLLAGLSGLPDTLLVLNHPLWDEPEIGVTAHFRMLHCFLRENGQWIHALEVNGLRPWLENQAVLRLARAMNFPAVSGGDRHGSAPNTVLNLTRASSFGEFVAEVRRDRLSTILAMPQYEGPHALRYLECTLDILREYPDLAGRRRWMDRAFVWEEDGSEAPLAAYWPEEGLWPAGLLSLARLSYSSPLRSVVQVALAAYQGGTL